MAKIKSRKDKHAIIGVKGVKIRSARKYVPKNVIIGHKYSFGTLYYYGADSYFVPKKGWKVTAG